MTTTPEHSIQRAAWLDEEWLLLVSKLPADPCASAVWRRFNEVRKVRTLVHPLGSGSAWLIRLSDNNARFLHPHTLEFSTGGSTIAIGGDGLASVETDPKTVAREHFTGLAAEDRAAVMQFLAGALCSSEGIRIHHVLASLREMLRERLNPAAHDSPQTLHVDDLFALDARTFYVRGWFRDIDSPATVLRAVSPEGAHMDLLPALSRHPRPDIARDAGHDADRDRSGFVCCFEMPVPSALHDGWIFELHAKHVESVEVCAPAIIHASDEIRHRLPAALPNRVDDALLTRQVRPALVNLAARERAATRFVEVRQFGTAPEKPAVSILIPLTSRAEYIEHQLTQFAQDPEVCGADIIFALCDPAAAADVLATASRLARLYSVPFRVAVPAATARRTLALDAASALGRAPLLILLGEAVFPARPGWLGAMISRHNDHRRPGAVAAKLLREDGSIASAGLAFTDACDSWSTPGILRGFASDFPAACEARAVPAASSACLLTDRKRFAKAGGYNGEFSDDTLADADLCLRLAAGGAENLYAPDAELHELPTLIKPAAASVALAQFDAWLFEKKWGAKLRKPANK